MGEGQKVAPVVGRLMVLPIDVKSFSDFKTREEIEVTGSGTKQGLWCGRLFLLRKSGQLFEFIEIS